MEIVVRVDDRGRISIPKFVREALGLRKGDLLRLKIEGGRIILEPTGGITDKFYGVFRAEVWPDDLDEFLVEAVKNWWRRSM